MDVNKVWLSGLALTEPVLTEMASKTPQCSFVLQVNEHYFTRAGLAAKKSNNVRVEALGRGAAITASKVRKGGRYFVEGSLRQDESRQIEPLKVRAFAVYKDEGADQTLYLEGLRQAVEIIKNCRDKEAALKTLEGLVASN